MNVTMVDFGIGNLHSLSKALESAGARVTIDADLATLDTADAIVFPGVGAFGAAAEQVARSTEALHKAIRSGKPCLGVCLGMQLLFESSEEGPGSGLCALAGTVRAMHARRLPHVGWNDVEMMDDPLFTGIDRLIAYYSNSYVAVPADSSEVIAWTQYGNDRFPAAVRRDNVWGVQFHPEKSGAPGLRLIRNFVAEIRN
jgi:imidazole glycerol-phosphate synthase subunit HisH